MHVHEFEHVIVAVAGILGTHDVIVVGSQAIVGQLPSRDFHDPDLQASREIDLLPIDHPEYADLISGSIGEGSPFDMLFGYFGDGVTMETVVAPRGWTDRLVVYESPNTNGVRAHCIERNDLVLAKYVASREKDRIFIAAMIHRRLCDHDILMSRAGDLPVESARIETIRTKIVRDFRANPSTPD